jgi:hypothetical protein
MPLCRKPLPFEVFLEGRGIRHKLISMVTPKQNGKVERSHRTDDEEFYNRSAYRKPDMRRRRLARHLDYYKIGGALSIGMDNTTEETKVLLSLSGYSSSLISVDHL